MTEAPSHIRLFERLQLTSIFFGLIHGFAIGDEVFGGIFGAAMMVAFTLLVSRGRKNWARWVWLVMFVFGAAFMIWNAPIVFALGFPAITVAVTLMQAFALILIFTPQSANWLRANAAQA